MREQPHQRLQSHPPTNGPAPLARPGPDTGGISSSATPTLFTAAEVARLWRDTMKDKSYRAFPLGQEAGHYLRAKRKRLTKSSYRDYESLPRQALPLLRRPRARRPRAAGRDAAPGGVPRRPVGRSAGRTYNKNLSIMRDFFKCQVLRGNLHGDPTMAIERAASAASTGRRSTPTRYAPSSPRRRNCATGSPCGCCSTTGSARAR